MMTAIKKPYVVTRLCCTSAGCWECREANRTKPVRIVHGEYADKEMAERTVRGWPDYKAQLETN